MTEKPPANAIDTEDTSITHCCMSNIELLLRHTKHIPDMILLESTLEMEPTYFSFFFVHWQRTLNSLLIVQ